jgi:hypothetical protein
MRRSSMRDGVLGENGRRFVGTMNLVIVVTSSISQHPLIGKF